MFVVFYSQELFDLTMSRDEIFYKSFSQFLDPQKFSCGTDLHSSPEHGLLREDLKEKRVHNIL